MCNTTNVLNGGIGSFSVGGAKQIAEKGIRNEMERSDVIHKRLLAPLLTALGYVYLI